MLRTLQAQAGSIPSLRWSAEQLDREPSPIAALRVSRSPDDYAYFKIQYAVADLTTAPAARHEALFTIRQQLLRHAGATAEQVNALLETYGREVALLPEAELEALLMDAGFVQPVRFCQSLLIHTWFARRA